MMVMVMVMMMMTMMMKMVWRAAVSKEFCEKILMAACQAHCIAGEHNDPQLPNSNDCGHTAN